MCMMTFELKKILLLLSLMVLISAPTGQTAASTAASTTTSTTMSTVAPAAASTAASTVTSTAASTAASIAASIAAPTLTFNCTSDGQILIMPSKPNNYHRITIRKESHRTLMSEDPNRTDTCEKELSDITYPIKLTGCLLNKRLYVYIMKEKLQKIYGGKGFHEYIILCTLPAIGIIQNVTATAIESATFSTPVPQTQAPTLALQMTFSPKTNVFVGENLTLNIKFSDSNPNSSLYILPESCSAKSGKPGQSSALNLLSKGTTKDAEIMTNFAVTKGSASATVYAFRFYDSKTVILECSVHICGDKSCNATFIAYASTPPPPTTTATEGGRKRRAAQNTSNKKPPTSTRVVKAMFTVKDEKKSTSGQSAVVNSCIAMFVLLQLQRILQQQQ